MARHPRPGSALFVAAFALLLVTLWAKGMIPAELLALYAVTSVAAFVAYWLDKSAARAGRSRVPERALHLISLAGGWPGALIAQQTFRHKTIKRSFRVVFWATVSVNLALLLWTLSARP